MQFILKRKISLVLQLFVLSIGLVSNAQELPPIGVFTPQDYNAEDQNWSISQGLSNELYFANNKGLLTYNGSSWQLYPTPNESILRSVKVIEDKIYTGCYMDFGYWIKDDFGKLNYTSLVKVLAINVVEDEQFWNIITLDNWVLFQSLNRIYIYNTEDKTVKIINSDTTLIKIYKVNDAIYFQKFNDGLYVIENGMEKLITNSTIIKDKVITNIFENKNDLLLQTKEGGFYTFKDNRMYPWNDKLNNILNHNSIYSSIKLRNGEFILGTVSHGIILLDEEGNIKLKINQNGGLSNNTVLSLFEDKRGNIWLGLDNGINIININSPFKVFNDDLGILGTVYTSIISDNKLYLGTNQGLFYKVVGSNNGFKFIEGTEGQVWSLQNIYDTIFCGHDKGTFVVNGNKVKLVSNIQGTWKIQKLKWNTNLLIQGNYSGLYVLERFNKEWKFRNKLKGFNISSRYFELLNAHEVLVSHEYKGVYKLKLNTDYTKVISQVKDSVQRGDKSSLVSYNGNILYAYEKGIFKYDSDNNTFIKDSTLSRLVKNYISGKLINVKDSNKLWSFSKDNLSYAQPEKLTSNFKISTLSLPSQLRKTKTGYENLLAMGNNTYLTGTTNGYIIIDLNKIESNDYKITLNSVKNYTLNQEPKAINIISSANLPNKSNNIVFSYSVSDFNKFAHSKYQYRLAGFNNSWSSWTEEPTILFENLPYGDYTFEAKAKVGKSISSNTLHYEFTINKPWFLKPIAIACYVLFFLLVLGIIFKFNQKYYKKQREKLLKKKEKEIEIKELENQKQLIQFKNKNLQQNIENKNRELGISTMNLINKNELLNDIKKELINTKKVEDLKSVVKLINKNLNTTDDWKLFEEAFNNADKDFLKIVKSKHSGLTSNDLRLCAYLRLNLSSKEIAPLLNISPRSVEVKRYRLRKKMQLEHDINLTNYILDL